ncbi:MAG: zinc-binding dehydrogenase, partial [Casimicrobiaceae bacterium]
RLLAELARRIDAGELRSTLGQMVGTINAANLKKAHALIESQRSIGKLVLAGF